MMMPNIMMAFISNIFAISVPSKCVKVSFQKAPAAASYPDQPHHVFDKTIHLRTLQCSCLVLDRKKETEKERRESSWKKVRKLGILNVIQIPRIFVKLLFPGCRPSFIGHIPLIYSKTVFVCELYSVADHIQMYYNYPPVYIQHDLEQKFTRFLITKVTQQWRDQFKKGVR